MIKELFYINVMTLIQRLTFQSIVCSFEYVIQSRINIMIGRYFIISQILRLIKSVFKSVFNKSVIIFKTNHFLKSILAKCICMFILSKL